MLDIDPVRFIAFKNEMTKYNNTEESAINLENSPLSRQITLLPYRRERSYGIFTLKSLY